jgi:hypothetical protein
MDEINTKENDSDTVLISNINSKCKSSAQNTSPSVKSDSDSNKHSLVTVVDSHTRGGASKFKNILDKNFNVTRFVNPGSNAFILADSAKNNW